MLIWTSPISRFSKEVSMADEDFQGGETAGNWLPCLDWNGREADLPLGSSGSIPGAKIEKFVYRWKVLDAESEAGFALVKKDQLTAESIIMGAVMNNNSLELMRQTYGPRYITIQPATGGPAITREEWRARYGTDGLELLAIRNKRREFNPGGVKF
jgi:hypothetical protein